MYTKLSLETATQNKDKKFKSFPKNYNTINVMLINVYQDT